jgi:hypothetical protein
VFRTGTTCDEYGCTANPLTAGFEPSTREVGRGHRVFQPDNVS